MSAEAAIASPARRRAVTFPRVVHSEWTKLISLRSTRYSLLAAVAMMILLAFAIALAQMGPLEQHGRHRAAALRLDRQRGRRVPPRAAGDRGCSG